MPDPKLSKREQKAAAFKKGLAKKSVKKEIKIELKAAEPPKPKRPAVKKYILFCGNLPYDITEQDIKDHFTTCIPSQVRMRKGFAFLDFTDSENLQKALRFHHSTLKYRKINVELTAGGGGNSKVRRAKLEKKNAALREELNGRIEQEKQKKQEQKASKSGWDLSGVHPSRREAFK